MDDESSNSSAKTSNGAPQLNPYKWKPGESGNPNGRPKDPPEVKEIKLLTKQYFKEIGSLIVLGNIDELERIAQDRKQPVIKVMIAAVAVKAMSKGDMVAIDMLLNRLIGKVKEEVELSGQVNTIVRLRLPANGREAK